MATLPCTIIVFGLFLGITSASNPSTPTYERYTLQQIPDLEVNPLIYYSNGSHILLYDFELFAPFPLVAAPNGGTITHIEKLGVELIFIEQKDGHSKFFLGYLSEENKIIAEELDFSETLGTAKRLIHDVALDRMSEYIYFTESTRITVCTVSAPRACTPVLENLSAVRGLTTIPDKGKLVWTQTSASRRPGVYISNMDGKEIKLLANVSAPLDVTWDYESTQIAWTEQIGGRVRVAFRRLGSPTITYSPATYNHPNRIQFFDSVLYQSTPSGLLWFDRMNFTRNNTFQAASNGSVFSGLGIYHAALEVLPKGYACIQQQQLCSHFCLQTGSIEFSYSCGCPPGLVLDESGTRCICPANQLMDSGRLQCRCPGSLTVGADGRTCGCPGNQVSPDGLTCGCPGNLQIPAGGLNCTCLGNQRLNFESTNCGCPRYHQLDLDGINCILSTCPETQMLDRAKKQCVCPANQLLRSDGHTCACPDNLRLSPDGITCICPNNMQLSADGRSCTCPASQRLNWDGTSCTCPPGMKLSDDGVTCIMASCPPTQVLSRDRKRCICPGVQILKSDGRCGCPANQVPGPSGTCGCKGNLKPSSLNGECICPPDMHQVEENHCACPPRMKYSTVLGRCQCPLDQRFTFDKSGCICGDDHILLPNGVTCGCSFGYLLDRDGKTCRRADRVLAEEYRRLLANRPRGFFRIDWW